MKTKKSLTYLDTESVSILTEKFIEENGIEYKVGSNHRVAYANSITGREQLQREQSEEIVTAVLSIWGSVPTIEDIDIKNNIE